MYAYYDGDQADKGTVLRFVERSWADGPTDQVPERRRNALGDVLSVGKKKHIAHGLAENVQDTPPYQVPFQIHWVCGTLVRRSLSSSCTG